MKRKFIGRGILTAIIVFMAAVMMTAFAFADDNIIDSGRCEDCEGNVTWTLTGTESDMTLTSFFEFTEKIKAVGEAEIKSYIG